MTKKGFVVKIVKERHRVGKIKLEKSWWEFVWMLDVKTFIFSNTVCSRSVNFSAAICPH